MRKPLRATLRPTSVKQLATSAVRLRTGRRQGWTARTRPWTGSWPRVIATPPMTPGSSWLLTTPKLGPNVTAEQMIVIGMRMNVTGSPMNATSHTRCEKVVPRSVIG